MNNSTVELYSVCQSVISFKLAVGTTQQLVVQCCVVCTYLNMPSTLHGGGVVPQAGHNCPVPSMFAWHCHTNAVFKQITAGLPGGLFFFFLATPPKILSSYANHDLQQGAPPPPNVPDSPPKSENLQEALNRDDHLTKGPGGQTVVHPGVIWGLPGTPPSPIT